MLLKVGIPTSIQNVATSVSFLFLTALVNGLGATASAAVGAVGKFNGFAILPAAAMSSSISAMAAQNIGAQEQARAVKTMKIGLLIALGISLIVFALAQLFPGEILRVFNDDPLLIEHGTTYMRVFALDYLIVPILFCLNGLFIGAGHTTFSLINGSMSSILIRIPASYLLGMTLNMGLTGVGLGAPLASFFALLLAIWFYFSGRWKKMTIITDIL